MPNLYEVIDRVKAAEREYYAVADAVRRLRDAVRDGQVPAPPRTTLRDLEAAVHQLEPTYVLRMWAEFETALRSYRAAKVHDPNDRIGASDLVNWTAGVKQGRAISEETRDEVHAVREYRNSLVHERDDPAPPVPIREARRHLNTFLGKLPSRW